MIFLGISVPAASLILQACYGMLQPEDGEISIQGTVVSEKTGAPILGINVSIEGTEYWNRTYKDGGFYFSVRVQDIYELKFEDVDGPYNGGLFKKQTRAIKKADTYHPLLINMDEE